MAIRYLSGINVDSNTLFVDDANNLVGIGTGSPAGSLHIQKNSANYSNEAVKITGTPLSNVTDGTSATEGYGLYLSYNVSGNRQFVFADTVSGNGVRYIGTSLDGFNKITQTRQDLNLGTETNGVHVAAGISNTQFSVSNVNGTASKIVTEIKGAASQSANYLNISSSGAQGDIVSVFSSGNVGIGTTTDAGRKLDVAGSISLDEYLYHRDNVAQYLRFIDTSSIQLQSSQINFSLGSTSAPQGGDFQFASPNGSDFTVSYTRTGQAVWKQKFVNQTMYWENNVGSVVYFANNDGNVGIGTTAPTSRLDVRPTTAVAYQGTVPYQTTTAAILSPVMTAASDDTYTSILQLVSVREALVAGRYAHGYLGFSTVDNSNVSGVLDAGRISIKNDDGIGLHSATSMGFWTNTGGSASNAATERMRITSGGNVGIGTTSPASKLQIGSVGSTGYSVGNGLAFGDGTRAGALNVDANGTYLYSSTNLIFSPGTTEAVRITSAGNVLIGTTTDAGYKLDVNGTSRFTNTILSTSGGSEQHIALLGYNTSYVKVRTNVGFSSAYNNLGLIVNTNINDSGQGNSSLPSWQLNLGGNLPDGDSYTIERSPAGSFSFSKLLKLSGSGAFQLNSYGSGTFTGTPAYNLAVDASGNVIELPGGVVDGSGTANQLARWQDANTLTNAGIEDNGSAISIGRDAFNSSTNYGTAYAVITGLSGGTAWFDTVTVSGARLYNITIFANPNSSGSGVYRDFFYGKIIIGTGYNGSAVVDFINYHQESPQPRSLYDSGGGNLTVTAVFVYGGSEVTEVPFGATYTIRIKIAGYVAAGAGTQINLQRIM